MTRRTLLTLAATPLLADSSERPHHAAELIFPLEEWHNHSSSVVQLPSGELLVAWFHGSGERQADDVKILAARRPAGGDWSRPFELADTPGFPDTNPVLYVDSQQRLWLFWPAILANTWETALMKVRMSTDYQRPGVPRWTHADNILLIPRNLQSRVQEVLKDDLRPTPLGRFASHLVGMAGDKLSSRLGWFTRTHPIELPSGRMLLPLYSDGFSFGLVALSDDGGMSWQASEPIVGYGNIQPSVVRRYDGTLVAWMRDNGPAPNRIHQSISKDDGLTWSPAIDTTLPNPGSSVEVIALRNGNWLLIRNDQEAGRNSLAVSISEDEGRTWPWTRHLESHTDPRYRFHYPSVIQAQDGSLHATYSYFAPVGRNGKELKSIKHANFNIAWVKSGK